MIRLLTIFLLACCGSYVSGQPLTKPPAGDTTLNRHYGADYIKAEFAEGNDSMNSYIRRNYKYPDAARENNVEGRVIIRFMVDEQGKISGATVVRGIGGGCDEAALKLVQQMPAWRPATYKNKATRSVVFAPIIFKLE